MRADFVNEMGKVLDVKRTDLIEKDLILHQILTNLSGHKFFADNFLFKGGTCLTKLYLGYFRFSEDIDFTWKDQKKFDGHSQKKVRKDLSELVNQTGRVFEEIATKRGLDFKCVKSNRDYVELGGSNKTCTFKIWYQSDIVKRRTFLKVQINFVERMLFTPKRGKLESLLTGKHEKLEALFTEYKEYSTAIPFVAYDIREIFCEKVRALLTREGTKARDFLDVYFISKKFGTRPESMERYVLDKLNFALKLYGKYKTNLKKKIPILNSDKLFAWGTEKDLLLTEIDEKEFYSFLTKFNVFLKDIVSKLNC
jgi:predicted nucleotidyltransferase component of viral defense system